MRDEPYFTRIFPCGPNGTVEKNTVDGLVTLEPNRQCAMRAAQCTLTVSSSWLQALATAASRLSVNRIGVPSAACNA
jgi:hypothetical protein